MNRPTFKMGRLTAVGRCINGFILDLIYPRMCISCGKCGLFLCSNCFDKIIRNKTKTCFYCGSISENGKICSSCRKKHKAAVSNYHWYGRFDGVTKELIHSYKYDGLIELSEIIAEMLFEVAVEIKSIDKYVVVPVPIHKSKMSRRGFNQSELIARILSEKLSLRGGDALLRLTNTPSQVGLSRQSRIKNLSGVITCVDRQLVEGQRVLLIDDVATTGATINACAEALRAAGAKRVEALFLARD